MSLIPINNCVLIELADQYEFAQTPDKEFSTKTSGYVVSVGTMVNEPGDIEGLVGKRVWFESYQDDIKIERDGKTYTFVKFENIRGYEDDEA